MLNPKKNVQVLSSFTVQLMDEIMLSSPRVAARWTGWKHLEIKYYPRALKNTWIYLHNIWQLSSRVKHGFTMTDSKKTKMAFNWLASQNTIVFSTTNMTLQ